MEDGVGRRLPPSSILYPPSSFSRLLAKNGFPGYTARLDFFQQFRKRFETTELAMPRVCYFTGKKTSFGNQITHRGKAKYLGGVGTKVTGITARKFKPNIQKVRAVVNGRIVRIKVSTKAIKMGLITKPVRRKYAKTAAAA